MRGEAYRTALTAERLRELLSYDPETGVFRWKVDRYSGRGGGRTNVSKGDVAGTMMPQGYLTFGVDGVIYRAHRVAWLYVYGEWPDGDVDHVNCKKDDNRIANLRIASRTQNLANTKRQRRNPTGKKGVAYNPRYGNFRANIRINGKSKHLGTFDTAEQAHEAYKKAATELFGEFARFE